jgi:2-polyprenyl-3-methyl-5-hydroxy-6-metoxy-1,4-benzoquinol methylase
VSHKDDQEFERKWWGSCQNTYGEETKQLVYARLMGLVNTHDGNSPYSFDLQGKSILDIGGGPSSLVLKCRNGRGTVVDPCSYPNWVQWRYLHSNIPYYQLSGENFLEKTDVEWKCDEVWIYNVLQHVENPELVIKNAKLCAPVLRIFEWMDIPPHEGHPHELTKVALDKWLDAKTDIKVNYLNGEGECYGRYYAGAFIKQSVAGR